MESLFSYGTLQLEKVQWETFGRTLDGVPDRLVAYKKETIKIRVESVVNLSGTQEHTIIGYTGNNSDVVEGVVLSITPGELIHADEYETEDYKRIKVTLQSGKKAWAYVKHDSK
ncbi:MAG TPA: gamma-glutamylcyclotransferase family protein [Flavisolibacter sp.]